MADWNDPGSIACAADKNDDAVPNGASETGVDEDAWAGSFCLLGILMLLLLVVWNCLYGRK